MKVESIAFYSILFVLIGPLFTWFTGYTVEITYQV